MIKQINHIGISSPDVERLSRFYIEFFGFEKVFDLQWDQGDKVLDAITSLTHSAAKVVLIKLGDMALEMFEFSNPKAKAQQFDYSVADHGISHFCFEVDEIELEYLRLKKAGMKFHCSPQDIGQGVFATYGRDPDGNVVELLQTPGSLDVVNSL